MDSGKEKLSILEENCKVFDESDGTEIDDDECLLACDKGTVLILGTEWKPAPVSPDVHLEIEHKVEKCGAESYGGDLDILSEAACKGSSGETEQGEQLMEGQRKPK